MDIPNLLTCLILARNTPFSLPPPLSLSIFLPYSPTPFSPLPFPIHPCSSLFSFFPFLFILPSLVLPASLPLYLTLPFSSSIRLPILCLSILPSLYFASFFSETCILPQAYAP